MFFGSHDLRGRSQFRKGEWEQFTICYKAALPVCACLVDWSGNNLGHGEDNCLVIRLTILLDQRQKASGSGIGMRVAKKEAVDH